MTLTELEARLAELRRLGATGVEPVILEGTVLTGLDGLKISTICVARGAALCNPVTLDADRVVRIWGVPE